MVKPPGLKRYPQPHDRASRIFGSELVRSRVGRAINPLPIQDGFQQQLVLVAKDLRHGSHRFKPDLGFIGTRLIFPAGDGQGSRRVILIAIQLIQDVPKNKEKRGKTHRHFLDCADTTALSWFATPRSLTQAASLPPHEDFSLPLKRPSGGMASMRIVLRQRDE